MNGARKHNLLCLISGVAYGFAWPPHGFWPFSFIMPAILFLVVSRVEKESVFPNVFLFSMASWLTAFFWIGKHPIGATASTTVIVLFSLMALLSAVISMGMARANQNNRPQKVLFAALSWFIFDLLLFWGPVPMPWLSIGLSSADSTWSLSWVQVSGPVGLSFLVLYVNGLLSLALLRVYPLTNTLLAALILLFPMLQGAVSDFSGSSEDAPGQIVVGIAQPGWPASDWADVQNSEKVQRLAQQSTIHAGEVDLVVFPETALSIGSDESLRSQSQILRDSLGAEILVGGILREGLNEADATYYNVSVSSNPENAIYRKRRLVPFAEKVPFSNLIPFFKRFSVSSGGVSSYSSGTDLSEIRIAGAQAGLLICYESLFFGDALKYRNKGAKLLIVQTQDGWWSSSHPRAQHFAFTRLLASAVGLPVVQVAVDGISGAIDAHGSVIISSESSSNSGKESYLTASVDLLSHDTIFNRLGHLSLLIIMGALGAILVPQLLLDSNNK